jgi:hypothetical protein
MVFSLIPPMNFNMQFEVNYVMSDLWLYSFVTLRGACSLFLQMVKFVVGLTSHAPGWGASHLSEIFVLLLLFVFLKMYHSNILVYARTSHLYSAFQVTWRERHSML